MLFDAESWAYQLCRLLSSYYTIIYLAGRDENTKIAYLKKDLTTVEFVKSKVKELCNQHLEELQVTSPHIGPPLPCFNIFTTNLAEGEALQAISNNTRMGTVLEAIMSILIAVNKTITYLNKSTRKMLHINKSMLFTPLCYRITMHHYSQPDVNILDVHKVQDTTSILGDCHSQNGKNYLITVTYNQVLKQLIHLCNKCLFSKMMQ